MHDLDDVWRDDQLIEALASGESVDTADPAAASLRALTGLVGAAPIPDYDIRDLETLGNIVVLDTGRSRRVAVRSLAVALTAVATLSTSGVAAVVTGDPFQPAKVVWHQIQERAGDRWGGDPLDDEDRLDSGSAIGGDTGEAETAGASGTSAQSALFEAARQAEEPSRLQRVALPRRTPEKKDGLEAGQAPSQDRAVAEAEAADGPQAAASSPAQEQTAAEERQARQDEESSGTATSEDSAQQREDAQGSEEEQESQDSQDSRRSDQPEEDEQEPTPDAPSDDLDPRVVPDSPQEDPTDGYGSMRSTEEDSDDSEDSEEDSEEDSGEFDGSTFSDSAPDEGTSSTEEPTEEESEDDGSWTGWSVQERAGSTDETVAPPRLNR